MKAVPCIILLSVLTTLSLIGQTNLWKEPLTSAIPIVIPDGVGNVYVAEKLLPDVLRKIKPNGTHAWSVAISSDPIRQMLYTGTSLYVFRSVSGPAAKIYSYLSTNTTGIEDWSLQLDGPMHGTASIDPAGNIYAAIEVGGNPFIQKVSPAGVAGFQTAIPVPSVPGFQVMDPIGAYTDGNKLLVVSSILQDLSAPPSEIFRGSMWVAQFDFSTGSFITQNKVYQENYHVIASTGTNSLEYDADEWPYFYDFVFVGGRLVSAANYHYRKHQTTAFSDKFFDFNELRILNINLTGLAGTMNSYVAPGYYKDGSGNFYTKSDNGESVYSPPAVGEPGYLYILGEALYGTMVNGVGTTHVNGIRFRYRAAEYTKAKVVYPNLPLYRFDYSTTYGNNGKNTFGLLVKTGPAELSRLNAVSGAFISGAPADAPYTYTFTDPIKIFSSAMNPEEGMVNLIQLDATSSPYLARYSLPSAGAMPTTTPAAEDEVVTEYRLDQNYPNPFNPTTTISFELETQSVVTLTVFNTLGQEIAVVLDNEEMYEGTQEVDFDASSLPSGVYFYRIVAQGIGDGVEGTIGQSFTSVKKMVVMK
ncbi:MAG: T9SS type A sorting domain-containing protein [Ignavibacteriae bacterium]|nr:T9SS type A sorting domain-containing protein [Ignavibacteria bacterium]MBI3363273.1 T9SS type A sorting domain-containing protein [Ignavibacteriota bacterium]